MRKLLYRIKSIKNTLSPKERIIFTSAFNLIINVLYAAGNLALGIFQRSYWFITAGAYYFILAVVRFAAVDFGRKSADEKAEVFIQKVAGLMLVVLSMVLCGSTYLSVRFDISRAFHEIIMITIATYTFTKIVLAIINFVKSKKQSSPLVETLRNITLCDAAVSMYSMQKSMLVSFEGMNAYDIKLMNSLTGAGVCLVVAALGILMITKRRT